MTDTDKNLFNLDELSGYKFANDYSDVRGWDVKDANNRNIDEKNKTVNPNQIDGSTFAKTKRLSKVNEADYDTVFYPGG